MASFAGDHLYLRAHFGWSPQVHRGSQSWPLARHHAVPVEHEGPAWLRVEAHFQRICEAKAKIVDEANVLNGYRSDCLIYLHHPASHLFFLRDCPRVLPLG